jgi:hypothetical protein
MWTPSCAMHPTPLGTPPPRGLIVRPLAHDDRFTTAELDLLEECAVERYTIGAAVDAASAQRRAVALRRQLQDETPDVLHQTAQDVCLDGALRLGLTYRQMTSQEGHHAAKHVERERDPLGMINGEGVITGTVVSAAVIAAAAGHLEETHIVLAILGTAFIYWLAHVHARTLGDAVKHRTHPVDALKEALAETWPILAASLVPAVILLAAQLFGMEIRRGAWIAVITSTVLLALYSFFAGRRGGLGLAGSLLSAAVGAGLGMLVIALKASLH